MAIEMRKGITSFEEFGEKTIKMDVIITYDIQTPLSEFRKNLLNYLGGVHSGITQLTESTYIINEQLTLTEIKILCNIIKVFYDANIKTLKESTESRGTRVSFILPAGTTLNIIEIILDKL